ncbi:MAG: FAD-dependent oxidoreductase, partial [Trueperaceae bacterium]|nr:FAD-dependent oxidoreductase [Trueperaceae bacterium]
QPARGAGPDVDQPAPAGQPAGDALERAGEVGHGGVERGERRRLGPQQRAGARLQRPRDEANSTTRLHPVEWAVGEAAGTLAAFCLDQDLAPREVWASRARTRALQRRLLERGAPIACTLDAPPGHPAFVAAQERALASPA